MAPASLIHLGDVHLTVALASAVTIWLLVADSRESARYWVIAVSGAFGVVAVSKIMYLGWGTQFLLLGFKAISGHAAGATAVLPMVLYLLANFLGRRAQGIALVGGWVISAAVAAALVRHGEHTVSEALAGWCLGALASGATCRHVRYKTVHPSLPAFGTTLAVTVIVAACMQNVPVGWWMIKTALVLSGDGRIHNWNDC